MATVDRPGGRLMVLANIPGSASQVAGEVPPNPRPVEVVLAPRRDSLYEGDPHKVTEPI
jgi:hypothetical protein